MCAGCRVALRRVLRFVLVLVLMAAFLIPRGDGLALTRTEEAAEGHLFSIAGWELRNFTDKWTHRLFSSFGGGISTARGRELLERYFALSERVRKVEGEDNRIASDPDRMPGDLERIDERLNMLKAERASLRNDVEEFLEGAISATLEEHGIGTFGPLMWPPVDFRLESPPRVLVTSPRGHIERLQTVLLSPDVTAAVSDEIEARVLAEQDLSAVVLGLGGLATFPTFVQADDSLLNMLEAASHEWLHAYLFFHPLGQHFNASADMKTLNETVANIAGKELGRAAFASVTGKPAPVDGPAARDPNAFSFDDFMRETRRMTDEFLADGRIEEAEAYMEARRVKLQGHGVFIRKINQAYFAFHGTYADTPFSTSPIGPEVEELRSLLPDVGAFITELQGVSSYEEFKALLDHRRRLGVQKPHTGAAGTRITATAERVGD